MFKKRVLKDIIKDIKITAITDGEFKYINSAMIKEALEYIMNPDKYYEVQSDLIDNINKLIKEL